MWNSVFVYQHLWLGRGFLAFGVPSCCNKRVSRMIRNPMILVKVLSIRLLNGLC
jgi:hypothetical protein